MFVLSRKQAHQVAGWWLQVVVLLLTTTTITIHVAHGLPTAGWEPSDVPVQKTIANGTLDPHCIHCHTKQVTRARSTTLAPPDVVFLGDSITLSWKTNGKSTWAAHFADRSAVVACSGYQTQHLLWSLLHGSVDFVQPHATRFAVLNVGTNNLAFNHTAEQVLSGQRKLLEVLHAKLPKTRVLVLAPFPRSTYGQAQNDDERQLLVAKRIRANAMLSTYLEDPRDKFVDLGHIFLHLNGSLRQDLFVDGLHLNAAGYTLLAKELERQFVKEAAPAFGWP